MPSKMRRQRVRDSDGVEVRSGDVIHFGYGIPPVSVVAPVIERDGKLIALTTGHKPSECKVADLMKNVGDFWVCQHVPKKAALDDSVHCIRCGTHLGEAN